METPKLQDVLHQFPDTREIVIDRVKANKATIHIRATVSQTIGQQIIDSYDYVSFDNDIYWLEGKFPYTLPQQTVEAGRFLTVLCNDPIRPQVTLTEGLERFRRLSNGKRLLTREKEVLQCWLNFTDKEPNKQPAPLSKED